MHQIGSHHWTLERNDANPDNRLRTACGRQRAFTFSFGFLGKNAIGFLGGVFFASIAMAQSTPLPAPTDPAYVTDNACWRQLQQDGDTDAAAACVKKSMDVADEELNRVYQEMLSTVDPNWPSAEDYKETLKEAQRAWITFRDADCSRVGVVARGNANLWIQTCYEYHTQKRTRELQAY